MTTVKGGSHAARREDSWRRWVEPMLLTFGFFGFLLGIIALPMPWISARLWEAFSPQLPFQITAAACALTVHITWIKSVRHKQNEAKPMADAVESQGDVLLKSFQQHPASPRRAFEYRRLASRAPHCPSYKSRAASGSVRVSWCNEI